MTTNDQRDAGSPVAQMKIPYVIDNQTHRLADVLNELLAGHAGKIPRHRHRDLADRRIFRGPNRDYLFKNTGQLLLRRTYSVVLPRTISMIRLWP